MLKRSEFSSCPSCDARKKSLWPLERTNENDFFDREPEKLEENRMGERPNEGEWVSKQQLLASFGAARASRQKQRKRLMESVLRSALRVYVASVRQRGGQDN